jgi:penicillin-binding protein 1A
MVFKGFNNWQKWLTLSIWAVAILIVTGIYLLFYNISKGDLPTFDELENPKYNLASVVYDTNGTPFGKYYVENRETLPYDSISPKIIESLLSTEDERFMQHSGIDFRALVRVFVKTILMQKGSAGGGSTISQQLSKLLFERPSIKGLSKFQRSAHLINIKFKEWITAIKLEKSYTKNEILAMYLNKFEFIYGAHGIQAAANIYFNKDQGDLDYSEAATLVGMLKNPALYNPVRFHDRAKSRRNIVLGQLKKSNKISKSVFDSLSVLEIDMSQFKQQSHDQGPAPFFRAELTKWLKTLFIEKNIKKANNTEYNIYTDGLKIYTTIDLNYQKHAEQAVFTHMEANQERYWKVWRGMNPFTYNSNKKQRELRLQSVDNRIINSDRYQSIKQRILNHELDKIENDYDGLQLTEKAISGMVAVKKRHYNLNKLEREGIIKEENISKCNHLMNSPEWDTLQLVWNNFEKEVDKQFNNKIAMKVFAYNEAMVKDTVLSPRDSVIYLLRHLQAGMLAMEPGTGHVKAWVGGVGFNYFKYDHINSRRQVGSTFKPIVYATGISVQGISPCQEFDDMQYTISPGESNFDVLEEWSPSNANGTFSFNKYNLYQGLLYSKNSITVKLVKELGNVEVIRDLARNMGIDADMEIGGGNLLLPKVPSIVLGAADISVMDMTGAYGTFANNGVYTKPVFVTRIEDKNGKVIYTDVPKQNIALNPIYNYVMIDMLKNNVAGKFTQEGVKSIVGGKTGTTNDYNDGWFMGITPNLVVGTWVGGDEKWVRFYTLEDGQGYVMARPIMSYFLQGIENDSLVKFDVTREFMIPANTDYKNLIDCTKNKHNDDPDEEQELNIKEKIQLDEFEEEFEEFEEVLDTSRNGGK